MSRPLEDLLAERERMNAELAVTQKELRKQKQVAKDKARSLAGKWRVTGHLMKVALIVYTLAGYHAAPAVRFLHTSARKRRWPGKSDEELERLVEDLFLSANMAEVLELCDTDRPSDPAAMQEAVRLVVEWRAVEYIEDANNRLGLAPSTALVLQKMEQNRLQVAEPVRPCGKGSAAEAKARMWAWRWRGRWGARHGRLRITEPVPLADRRSKVLLFLRFGGWRVEGPWGPKSETIFGLARRARKTARQPNP